MKWLMYCVFAHCSDAFENIPPGVQGRPVVTLKSKALGTAVSQIDMSTGSCHTASLTAYHNVIAALHSQRTVVPLRFGAFFSERVEIKRLLESKQEGYRILLKELDGCVEMGIRVILDEPESSTGDLPTVSGSSHHEFARGPDSGRSYLQLRKRHYSLRAMLSKEAQHAMERYRAPFEGLFAKCRAEPSTVTGHGRERTVPVLSLYFLVPRGSLAAFRAAFRELSSLESRGILLSGPWPPYNFVLPEDSPCSDVAARALSDRGM